MPIASPVAPLIHVADVIETVNHGRQFIYDRIQEGVFEARRHPGSKVSKLTITRRSVDAYTLASALYPPPDLAERLYDLAKKLGPVSRRELAERLLTKWRASSAPGSSTVVSRRGFPTPIRRIGVLNIFAMFTESAFTATTAELARVNGISEDLAGDYLVRIGDTPELADDGRVIVRDDAAAEIARVIWPE